MSVTVEPIRPEERPPCQSCGTAMQPRWPEQKRFESEEAFAAFSTNRRVYAMRRRWNEKLDERYEPTGERVLNHIEISFYPDDRTRWGSDGLFCTREHAVGFAYEALKAGYRMKGATK